MRLLIDFLIFRKIQDSIIAQNTSNLKRNKKYAIKTWKSLMEYRNETLNIIFIRENLQNIIK